MIDTPAIERVFRDPNSKTLFKGILSNSDLVVCVVDAFDCDIQNTKLSKIIRKYNEKDFLFVIGKADMLENDEEIQEQI